MATQFISQDKDIVIIFQKEKVNRTFSFAKTDEEDRYLYTMIFKNMVGTVLKIIQLSDCEMYILLDNIYYFLQSHNNNMTVSLSCKDSIGQFYIFTIDTYYEEEQKISQLNSFSNMKYVISKNIFKIYQHLGDTLTSIISFDISNSLPEFANCIYNICIEGISNIDIESGITPTNIGTLIKPDFLL